MTILRRIRRLPSGFGSQLVVTTALVVAAVMVVLIGSTQAVLEWTAHLEINHALDQRTATALSLLREARDPTTADLEPGTRLYASGGGAINGDIERAVTSTAVPLVHAVLTDGGTHTRDAPADIHLQATPYDAGGRHYAVVVTQDAEPYERSETYALLAEIVLGVLATAIAAAVAWRVTRRALEPVQQMAERAAEWSEHDLGHRFELGPPVNELAALGETMDHLLDRVAAAIRSEQRLTSELAHELRTPLTAARGSSELARLRARHDPHDPALLDDLDAMDEATARMDVVVTTLLTLARTPEVAVGSSRAAEVIARVAALVPDDLEFATDVPDGLPALAGPADVVVRALGPIVENAVHHANSTIRVSARAAGRGVEVRISDDGPGVVEHIRERLFDPGHSGRGGTGLGLGIAQRIARSLGGEITLADPATAAFVLRLPCA